MADSLTVNYDFVLPEVGASDDTWGTKLNTNWVSVDTELKAVSDILSAHIGVGGSVHAVATTGAAGFMSAADKVKINSVQTGAQVNTPTTAARNSSSTTTVLQAKAMNDHVASGDHDGRYVRPDVETTFTEDLRITSNSNPRVVLKDTAGALDNKTWQIYVDGPNQGPLYIMALNDPENVASKFFYFDRLAGVSTPSSVVTRTDGDNRYVLQESIAELEGARFSNRTPLINFFDSANPTNSKTWRTYLWNNGTFVIDALNDDDSPKAQYYFDVNNSALDFGVSVVTRQKGDVRYTQRSLNLSDLPIKAAARTNLGLGNAAETNTTDSRTSTATNLTLQAKAMNDHRNSGDHDARYARIGQNLADLTNPATARTNLGLGTAATTNVGTASGQVPNVGQADARYVPKVGSFGTRYLYRNDADANQALYADWDGTRFFLQGYDFNAAINYEVRVASSDRVAGFGLGDLDFRYLNTSNSANVVGSVGFFRSATSVPAGGFVAGSQLSWTDHGGTSSFGNPSGTWMACGQLENAGRATVYRRVA